MGPFLLQSYFPYFSGYTQYPWEISLVLCFVYSSIQNISPLILFLFLPTCQTWVQLLLWNFGDKPAGSLECTPPVFLCARQHVIGRWSGISQSKIKTISQHSTYFRPLIPKTTVQTFISHPEVTYWLRIRFWTRGKIGQTQVKVCVSFLTKTLLPPQTLLWGEIFNSGDWKENDS